MPVRLLHLLACCVLLAGCSSARAPSLDAVRAIIAEAEAAAEARDPAALVALLSEDFAGHGGLSMTAHGHTRSAAAAIVSATIQRHDAVHLLTRVRDLELIGPGRASATLFVAMAGRPIPEPGAVASTSATLYRFDLVIALEGREWRIRKAEWRRAQPADFL